MVPIFIKKPPITHRQKALALAIAGAVDILQIAVFPMLLPGYALDDALDVIAAIVFVAICGFKWQFFAVFILELVPGLDLFPTWTALAMTLPAADSVSAVPPDLIVNQIPPTTRR